MSVLFFDGFDYGLPASPKWSSVSLSNAFTPSSGRRAGTGALDLESTADHATLDLSTASTDLIIGVALKGYAEGVAIELYEGATKHVTFSFGASPNYYMIVHQGDGTVLHTDADANTPGSWSYYEFRVKIHNTAGTVDVMKDGVSIISLSNIDTNNAGAVGTVDKVKLRGTHAGSTWYDDLYVVTTTDAVSPTAWLGPTVRVDTLLPTTDDTTEWAPSTGTTHWSLVDEVPASASDYVESSTLNARDLYLLSAIPYTPTTIYGVNANIVITGDAGTLEAAPAIKVGVTNYSPTGTALSASSKHIAKIWTTNPSTALAWTRAEVNALAAGVKLTAV